MSQEVLRQIDREELIETVQDLVRIPSHKGVPKVEKNVAKYIAGKMKKERIDVHLQEVVDGRPNIIAMLKGTGNGPSLMLNGHLDTMPPADKGSASFAANIREGKIFGCGAWNMKGGIGAMVTALIAIRRARVELCGDLTFTGVVGEASSQSEGTKYIIEHGPRSDMAIVGEPTDLVLHIAGRGMMWIEIVVKGRMAIGSMPSKGGINSIIKACELVTDLDQRLVPILSRRQHHLVPPPSICVGLISGGISPNRIPDTCTITIDKRYIPGETEEEALKEIKEFVREHAMYDPLFKADVHEDPRTVGRVPMEIPSHHPLPVAIAESFRRVVGKDIVMSGYGGFTDASFLVKAGIPAVIFGPEGMGVREQAAKSESVEIEQLITAARVYALTALKIAGIENSL